MPLNTSILALSLLSLLIAHTVVAREETDYFDLDLEQLMAISVASKQSEDPTLAPGAISIITREHIRNFGGLNLGDLIDRLTNTQVMGSSLYPRNRTSLRAVTQTHVDDKILILLDGRPIRDAAQGGINGDLYATFPIESIEQIEIIRGPGSVLYGTNAFSGVFNIVTVLPSESQNMFQLRSGSESDGKVWAIAHRPFDDGYLSIQTQAIQHEGTPYPNIAGEVGDNGQHGMGHDHQLLHLKGEYANHSATILYSDTRLDHASNLQSYPSEDWDIKRLFMDIGSEVVINQHWKGNLNLTMNQVKNTAFILSQSVSGNPRFFTSDTNSYLLDAYLQNQIDDHGSLLIGVSHDHLSGNNVSDGVINTEIETWRHTWYGQWNYHVVSDSRLTLGGQYTHTKEGDSNFSPRIMLTHSINKRHSLKMGWDEAYRSPFGLDLFVEAAFLQGNADLTPETIRTFTLQHNFKGKGFRLSNTVYYSEQHDLIVRDESQDPVTLTNSGSVDYLGLELEYQWHVNSHWQLEGNASYQENESDAGQQDIGVAPNWMLKQGISGNWHHTQFGLYANYFSDPTDPESLNPSVIESNPNPKAYIWATLQVRQSLKPWMGNDLWSVRLYVDNLLNESSYYPEIARKRVNSFPLRERRTFYLMLDYQP